MMFSEKDENQRLPYPEQLFFHHCLSFTHKGLMRYILVLEAGRSPAEASWVTRWHQRQFLASEGSENHLGNPSLFFFFFFSPPVTQKRSYTQSRLPATQAGSVLQTFYLCLSLLPPPCISESCSLFYLFSLLPFSSVISVHLCLSLCESLFLCPREKKKATYHTTLAVAPLPIFRDSDPSH